MNPRKMKIAAAAVLLLAFSPAGRAELQGSDEQFYAVLVAALEKCESAFPEGKADYAKVRSSLDRLAQTQPKLSAVLKSPTLAATLVEARAEMEKYLAGTDKKAVCTALKQGQFGQMGIPLEP